MCYKKIICMILSVCVIVGSGSGFVFADTDEFAGPEELTDEVITDEETCESSDEEEIIEVEETEESFEVVTEEEDSELPETEDETDVYVEEEGETYVFEETDISPYDIEVNENNFPDDVFRNYVLANIAGGDEWLTPEEREAVVELDLSGKQITDLSGIKFFEDLEVLDISNNLIQIIDLSENTQLRELYCSNNYFSTLELSTIACLSSAVEDGERDTDTDDILIFDLQVEEAHYILSCDETVLIETANTCTLTPDYYIVSQIAYDFTNALEYATDMAMYKDKKIVIIIPSGSYELNHRIPVFSNTAIIADPDTVVTATFDGSVQVAMLYGAHTHDGYTACPGGCDLGGYAQLDNITISGGTWDRGEDNVGGKSSAFIFRHGNNITISDCTILHCVDHFVNASGCSNVTISGVTFRDALRSRIYSKTQYEYVEAVHTDYTNQTGEDSDLAKPWDNTASINVTVTGCTFSGVMSGIGTHHNAGSQSKRGQNYVITNNIFSNLPGYCLYAWDFDGVTFSGNTCTNCSSMVLAYRSTNVNVLDNTYNSPNSSDIANVKRCAIFFDQVTTGTISGNSINKPNTDQDGIQVCNSSSNITIDNNTVKNSTRYGIVASSSTSIVISNCVINGTGAGYSAIQIENLSGNNLIQGNEIQATSTDPKPGSSTYADGINVKSSSEVRIINNTVSNTGRRGIYVNNGSNSCNIIGNIVTDVPKEGIMIEGKDGTVISGTLIYDNIIRNTGSHGVDLKYCDLTTVKQNDITGYASGKNDIHQSSCTRTTIERYHADGWFYDPDTKKYYYYINNVAVTGWKKISNKWYYFNSSGEMQTGWQKLGGKWYYFASSGAMQTGWTKLSGKWYYFNSDGSMKTGWYQEGGKWYHFASGGEMQTGWQKLSGKWYYFNGGGDMKTGWFKSGGKWYYFDTGSGYMLASCSRKIGNKTYRFDANGICLNP